MSENHPIKFSNARHNAADLADACSVAYWTTEEEQREYHERRASVFLQKAANALGFVVIKRDVFNALVADQAVLAEQDDVGLVPPKGWDKVEPWPEQGVED